MTGEELAAADFEESVYRSPETMREMDQVFDMLHSRLQAPAAAARNTASESHVQTVLENKLNDSEQTLVPEPLAAAAYSDKTITPSCDEQAPDQPLGGPAAGGTVLAHCSSHTNIAEYVEATATHMSTVHRTSPPQMRTLPTTPTR